MRDDVEIPQTSGGVGLRLFGREVGKAGSIDYFTVELRDPSVFARLRVYSYESEGIVSLFQEMARDWKGWTGEKVWTSLEGEMSLACSSDRMGHVAFGIRLRETSDPPVWQVTARVRAEAGQLGSIAAAVTEFFAGGSGPS